MPNKYYRVLSIQSHVVSGYVGNKSACFPLQILGFEVDPVNSVQFSNHSGYPLKKGQVLNENDLGELMEGLKLNGLDQGYTHLLTGYIGNPSFLHKVAQVVKHLKTINPSMIYVCDPVMGDNGRMYVPETLLPIYRETILPLADILTPNQYEAELLTGKPIRELSDALSAVEWFHQQGVETVAISSSTLGTGNNLLAVASSNKGGRCTQAKIEIPLLDATFTGTGDLFAALFLAWMAKTDERIDEALEKTVSVLQAVLKRTFDTAKQRVQGDGKISRKDLELRLIQSKTDIEEAVITFKASKIGL